MSKKRVVVSLGHDALGYTTTEQWDAVKVTAKALADLVEADYQLTITHSNGPHCTRWRKSRKPRKNRTHWTAPLLL